jgi:hypothetical protein
METEHSQQVQGRRKKKWFVTAATTKNLLNQKIFFFR